MAYEKQSDSLQYVQQYGSQLEKSIRNFLNWEAGRIIYFEENDLQYDLQVDCAWPNCIEPEAFVSVTYTKPDKPGHSNENKLQLKIGELILLKARYPQIRSILVVGGSKSTWLPYVLEAFEYFFDIVIFMWDKEAEKKLREIRDNPNGIALRHENVWNKFFHEWNTVDLWEGEPINSSLRQGIWELASELGCEGELPEHISNRILRHCMQAAYQRSIETRNISGKEWTHYLNEDWDKLWQSRSFYNPSEAAIELSLLESNLAYLGGLAKDVDVPSLLHHIGGTNIDKTKVSEDFVLFSLRDNKPVLIQSKSSGGGLDGHGKNIQNRTKEQLCRSLIYRGMLSDKNEIELRDQDFIWIAVLDGNWGVTKRTPLKYLHMLQWAGYNFLLSADSLVNEDYDLLPVERNPLIRILQNLECCNDQEEFQQRWEEWYTERIANQ